MKSMTYFTDFAERMSLLFLL